MMTLQKLVQIYVTVLVYFQLVILNFILKLGFLATIYRGIRADTDVEDKESESPWHWHTPEWGVLSAPGSLLMRYLRRHWNHETVTTELSSPQTLAANTMLSSSSISHQDNNMAPISQSNTIEEITKSIKSAACRVEGSWAQFSPLLVALVGLPARGKTHIAHRLARHLNWQGESTKVFDCSEYRRRRMEAYGRHDIFRADHPTGASVRRQSARDAVHDAIQWLNDGNSVAIFDGTNITAQQRCDVQNHCVKELGFRVLFIECICDDEDLLEKHIVEILHYSPDYKNMTESEALEDVNNKLNHYMEQYEPIKPKTEDISYIQMRNGGESVKAHKLSGQRESAILGYLSNVKPMPQTLYFTRHGESEFNVLGRIGGDSDLSSRGKQYARALAQHFNKLKTTLPNLEVWTSEMKRTKQTAEGILAPKFCVRPINELDAGICEGLTYEEMQQRFPQEFAWRDQDKLRYRYPWGESYIDIMSRLRPALTALDNSTNVLVVGHQAVLRCVLGYFLDAKLDELPYMTVPLHTIIKLTAHGHKYHCEMIQLPVECVNTHRIQPKNCSTSRTSDDALVTVPSHYDTLPSSLWQTCNGPTL